MNTSSLGKRFRDETYTNRDLIGFLLANPFLKEAELARMLGKSERSVRREIAYLREVGVLIRLRGKKDGHWMINI